MEAVILIGIQASGKTTFYRERFFDTHIRISLDMLRTRNRERILLAACLAAQQPFVIDNTNATPADRARYLAPAKSAGFRTIGYFFRTDLKAALARNAKRADKKPIPAPGVVGCYKRIVPPGLKEGFDELFTVELTDSGQFMVEPFQCPPKRL